MNKGGLLPLPLATTKIHNSFDFTIFNLPNFMVNKIRKFTL